MTYKGTFVQQPFVSRTLKSRNAQMKPTYALLSSVCVGSIMAAPIVRGFFYLDSLNKVLTPFGNPCGLVLRGL